MAILPWFKSNFLMIPRHIFLYASVNERQHVLFLDQYLILNSIIGSSNDLCNFQKLFRSFQGLITIQTRYGRDKYETGDILITT